MLKFFKKKSEFLFSIMFFIVAVAGTVILFPREGKFRFEFRKGSPWMHENLIARYDFPVYKSEEQLQSEKDSILSDFHPYFNYNEKIGNKAIIDFKNYHKTLILNLIKKDSIENKYKEKEFENYKNLLSKIGIETEKLLKKIYNTGIPELSEFTENIDTKDFTIVILKNKIGTDYNFDNIYTQKKAYREITEMLTKIYKKNNFSLPEMNLENYIQSNLFYDKKVSEDVRNQLINEVSLVKGMIQSGERIIYKGELIDEKKFMILESLKREYETSAGALTNESFILLGQIILVLSVYSVLFFFLYYFYNHIINSNRQILYFLSLTLVFVIVSALFVRYSFVNVYILPIAILPVLTVTFYNPRLAILHHTVTILIIGFLTANGFEYVFIQFIVGSVAVFGISKLHNRAQILLTALLIFLVYIFVYSGIAVTHEGDIFQIDLRKFLWFAISSALILLSYPIIYVFEKLFGFISDVTLIEISDTNRPLLRELAQNAPGTFQHSVQVANLAESAIRKIKGNTLLVRAGAMYHDIGKIASPGFFTENQYSGFNPHSNVSNIKSAEIIINHVTQGVELAKKNKIPKEIIDFILTHHGLRQVKWFLHAYKQKNPEIEIDEKKFTYPGPKPKTKETAVLMMADSVEAASRSLQEINENTVNGLVEKIVNSQIEERQFDDADITFSEISEVKEVFKQKLRNIYHSRIKYPE